MSTTLVRDTTGAAGESSKDSRKEETVRQTHQLRIPFFLGLLVIVLVAAIPYISLACNSSKFNRAEVFFAECAREMLQTANLVTPLYHGQGFFDKPILVYWMILTSFKAFGVSHLTARIPSIIFALSTITLTGVAAGRLFSPASGLLAAMSLGSAFMFMSFANLCMSDMPLVFFDCASLSLLYAALSSQKYRNICFWLASLSLGLGFLTKGPVGIVLPLISFAAYLTICRQWHLVRFQHVISSALIMAASASPWFFAAYRENGAGALVYFFIRENVQRFAGATYDTHRPLWYMIVCLFSGFAPWSIFLPFAFKDFLRKWREQSGPQNMQAKVFLWLWIGTVTLFFSVSRGKIDYYVLPVYPAAAILTASYITSALARKSAAPVVLGWISACALAAAGIASIYFLQQLTGNAPAQQWLLIPIALCGGGALMALALFQKLYLRAYAAMFAAICLSMNGFALQIFPVITRLQAVQSFRAAIVSSTPETRIGVYSTIENWIDEITFQTNREPLKIKNVTGANLFLASPAEALLLIPESEFQRLPLSTLLHVQVLDSKPFVAHALNPGYVFGRHGNLTEGSRLLLVSNRTGQ